MATKRLHKCLAMLISGLVLSGAAMAHCDRLDGPVAQAAVQALEGGTFETVQIWVGPEQESELRNIFEQALRVRGTGGEAKKLADRYFIETAVRLHREAEGMPYTGLKPAGLPVPADLQAADRAVETGDLEPLRALITDEFSRHLRHRFEAVQAARKSRDRSVEAGREWVDSYVQFVVFSHGLYETIQAGPQHGIER